MKISISLSASSAILAGASLVAAAPQSSTYNVGATQPDYVIIGGGPAGFVLAEQLSRNPEKTVVLLEAGSENANVKEIDVPGLGPQLLQTQHTWNFSSQPDPNLGGNAPYLHQGRGFGGGSAVNYLGACRGAPSVFDEWAQISGDEGLRWNNFINDYKATVHFNNVPTDYETHINTSAYGNGPLELTAPQDNLGFVLQLIRSWTSVLRLPWVDVNDGHGLGIATSTAVIRASNRTRIFAPQAYGWPMARRPNAQQLHNSQVTKINFAGKRATSVNIVDPTTNTTRVLRAKETIVAAGALNSPKLLMLSGIGPAAQLKSLGIPLVADIPQVGSNLLDHHAAIMEFEAKPELETLWQYTQNATEVAITEQEYRQNGSGPLGAASGAAFALSRVPDSVFQAVGDTYHPSLPADRAHLLWQYSNTPLQAGTPNVSIVSPFVSLCQPEAAGYMRLASADYRDDPLIYSNWYGSKGDKAAILYGYKLLREVVRQPEFSNLIVREIFPGANVTSDDELWRAISQGAASFHHPMGTIALGTVVNGKNWRVKGLDGIRVVDSSTFPTMPTCHPMATVYAYAYHAAQLIKRQDR